MFFLLAGPAGCRHLAAVRRDAGLATAVVLGCLFYLGGIRLNAGQF
ncbi:hypothetical protein ACNKHK_06535 [Shigella flexneri]